jgi:phage baseplate assembly protein W
MTMNVDYPFHFDGRGRTGEADEENHLRDLIEQVLFTSPGERVNRPDFGAGLSQLVFAPNGGELVAASQLLVQASLQHWLGDLIVVERVDVTADDSRLEVRVQYIVRRTSDRRLDTFDRAAGLL